jgi:hypothetical protein
VRESQGRELFVFASSGELVARHLLRPRGSPPVLLPEHYEGLRRRHRAALSGLARQLRERYGPGGVTEVFLQRLLAQHRHHPERPLAQVLQLLEAAPLSVAQEALADAVEFNLCTPRFLEERLRRRWREGDAGVILPTPAVQLTLPRLEVERSLLGYGRALD